MKFVMFFLVLVGFCAASRTGYRFIAAPPLSLLPPIDTKILPNRPGAVDVPNRTATARKQWLCEDCHREIDPGDAYRYFEGVDGNARRARERYCLRCAHERERRADILPELRREYEQAVERERRRQCMLFYGSPPESLGG
jgi:hypothetical protein